MGENKGKMQQNKGISDSKSRAISLASAKGRKHYIIEETRHRAKMNGEQRLFLRTGLRLVVCAAAVARLGGQLL
ncbi:hypothetical protein CON01_01070 [Bacillus thuringiensis]|uniref:Uncharacterized protein n=1 Tax=Bacillus thuringiensis TaxID=1428 RepID=A0A9X6U4Z1_BACTU|nr:hypothetical protein CON01_01070 [Bacillus thuringiensis]PGO85236.1 hypothetical protein CN990_21365 [Bacillus thuringiensis]